MLHIISLFNIPIYSINVLYKTKNIDFSMSLTFGAGDRNRTCTPKALDPKSSASASSATPALKW